MHYTNITILIPALYARRLPLLWPSHSLFWHSSIPAFLAFQHSWHSSIPAFHRHPTAFYSIPQASHSILAILQVSPQTANSWTARQQQLDSLDSWTGTIYEPLSYRFFHQPGICGLLIIIFSLLLPGLILLL